jgi:8-oxo-dGTP pyrophosphatase MutT (NUDIX family)
MTGEIKALPRAASVVLLREGEGDAPFEVYMLRRLDSARFAPGAHSFPGGVLDAPDYAVASAAIHALPGGLTVTALHERFQVLPGFAPADPPTTGALLVCAVRELFEEAGVLLVREEEGGILPLDNDARWADAREDLLAGSLQFGRLLSEDNLTIAPDDLIYFSHWITPEASRIRFDTHFFLGVLPPGQMATHWPGEMAAGEWLTPREGLARHARGVWPMLTVQTKHLERFAEFDSLDALLDHARTKAVPPVLPTRGPTLDPNGREATLSEEIAACW